ncbi:hypothetical protein GOP47_0009655 [Adiantum capillus-veneris]|uniref:Uncharacterized protein n=1 Tax=Adiantum capillus-veneris TaxID=13818 RepID=A0A9D4ZHF0_ADICA|nr:hypothetical protein GOP47_0009655 [Adiantum capillus-veneris]
MAMADSDNLASRLLLRQSSVSKRVKLEDPAASQSLHTLHDEDDDVHGAGVTFSAVSSSSPSCLHNGTGKRPRPPRLSSHGLTPELLFHMRPSKIRFSSKSSDKTRFSEFSRVFPPAEEASTNTIEEASSLEWQLLPCLKEVIPGDLRQSVLQPCIDRLSTVIQSDAPRSVQSFPKVSRTSSRHGPVPKPSRLAQSRYSGELVHDGVSGESHEAWNSQTKSGVMLWKRRRGKFAVSSPSDATSYMWMSFLNLLRQNPDYPEFIYLQPAKASRSTFDPYDLDIVAHNEVSSPYFYTMSSAGVTLFRDLDAEFISLDEWETDFEYYKCIMKLNVFRQYKLWKTFYIWRRFVRKKLQRLSRKSLIKQLFSINPILQRVLLQICQMSLSIAELHLFHYERGTVYLLEEFIGLQEKRRRSILERLMEVSEHAVGDVKDACVAVLIKIEEDLLGQQSEDTQYSTTGTDNSPTSQSKGLGSKLASVAAKWKQEKEKAAEEKENQERFTFAIAAAKRNERGRLLKFLRLADYIIAQSLRAVLIRSFAEVLKDLSHPSVQGMYLFLEDSTTFELINKKEFPTQQLASSVLVHSLQSEEVGLYTHKPFFEVKVVIEDDRLQLQPDSSTFLEKFEEFLRTIPEGLKRLQRLVSHCGLNEVVERTALDNDSTISYMDLIGDKQYGDVITMMRTSLQSCFQDAEAAITCFQSFLEIYVQNRTLSIDCIRNEVAEGRWDIGRFRQELDSFLQQVQDINSLSDSKDVGVLLINIKRLKESLLPSPQKCLQAIFTLIPELVSQLYQAFITEIHMATKKLLSKPSSVEEFVQLANFLQVSFHSKTFICYNAFKVNKYSTDCFD